MQTVNRCEESRYNVALEQEFSHRFGNCLHSSRAKATIVHSSFAHCTGALRPTLVRSGQNLLASRPTIAWSNLAA